MVNFHMSSCTDRSGEGDAQGFAPVGYSRSALLGAERFYSAHENISSSLVYHNNSRTAPQEAQKLRPARPQRVRTRGVPLGYVEVLNDARTPHGKRRVSPRRGWAGEKSDFFSVLLFRHEDQHPWGAFVNHVRKPSGSTAGGNTWKDASPTNLNGAETIGEILSRE